MARRGRRSPESLRKMGDCDQEFVDFHVENLIPLVNPWNTDRAVAAIEQFGRTPYLASRSFCHLFSTKHSTLKLQVAGFVQSKSLGKTQWCDAAVMAGLSNDGDVGDSRCCVAPGCMRSRLLSRSPSPAASSPMTLGIHVTVVRARQTPGPPVQPAWFTLRRAVKVITSVQRRQPGCMGPLLHNLLVEWTLNLQ